MFSYLEPNKSHKKPPGKPSPVPRELMCLRIDANFDEKVDRMYSRRKTTCAVDNYAYESEDDENDTGNRFLKYFYKTFYLLTFL